VFAGSSLVEDVPTINISDLSGDEIADGSQITASNVRTEASEGTSASLSATIMGKGLSPFSSGSRNRNRNA